MGVLFAAGVTACLLATAHVRPTAGGGAAASPPRSYDPLVDRPNEEGDSGELIYVRYCAGCHGVKGDGQGPAARLLSPRPRDFTLGFYKFTTTPANSVPLDEDILRAITEGLHGTSMPSWRLLPLNERKSLVRYVRAFHTEWHFRSAAPAIPFHENPFDMEDAASIEGAVQLGREVYHKQATCWGCHPAHMERGELERLIGTPARPDLDQAIAKPDRWGETILPPDFRRDTLKSVRDMRDLYRVIAAGVGGTAMPTWKDSLKADQLWALTFYVDSLRRDSIIQKTLKKLREERR
jgi:mono/diheme cytochrome c family protein